MRPLLILLLSVGAPGFLCSCGGHEEDPFSSISEALVGGTEMWDYPAIGRVERPPDGGGNIGYCTGTLVSPNVVITAAHCMNYTSQTTTPSYGGFFQINPMDNGPVGFIEVPIVRWVSFASNKLDVYNDIAILQLAWPVALTHPHYGSGVELMPFRIATTDPTGPPTVTPLIQVGYGCTNRQTQEGGGVKRFTTTTFGTKT